MSRLTVENLRQQAQQGDAESALVISVAEELGWIDADRASNMQHLKTAANSSRLAKYLLARRLLTENTEVDEALNLLRLAAEAGFGPAATELGVAYKGGVGVERNAQLADSFFRRAADLGDPAGWAWLGMRYVSEKGEISDPIKAEGFFERAVEGGYFPAFSWLSIIYLTSKKDDLRQKALVLLNKGAAARDFGCLSRLSRFYRSGEYGFEKNEPLAKEFELLAKRQIGRTAE